MASSHSPHEARRSRDQQPSTSSSEVNSLSEGSTINHHRPGKSVARALREDGYINEGDAIQFFSRSVEAWLDGEVVQIFDDNSLRVDYQIGQYWIAKTLHLDSEDIVFPNAPESCLEESDPMGARWNRAMKRAKAANPKAAQAYQQQQRKKGINQQPINQQPKNLEEQRKAKEPRKVDIQRVPVKQASIPRSWRQDIYAMAAEGWFTNASVFVLGRSQRHSEVVALLGGGAGKHGMGFRYCDFGGKLDGGPGEAERCEPHLGAFRELAEELLGVRKDKSAGCASHIWQACKGRLIGDQPVAHDQHVVYLVPARAVLDGMKSYGRSIGSFVSSIDTLAEEFRQNDEVVDVKMFSICDLLDCLELGVQKAPLYAPSWTSTRADGRKTYVFPHRDQIKLEFAYNMRNNTGVKVLGGNEVVNPITRTHHATRKGKQVKRVVARNEEANIRYCLIRPWGSLASCMPYLTDDAVADLLSLGILD